MVRLWRFPVKLEAIVQLPVLFLVDTDSVEKNAIGQERMKSNPAIEQVIFEGQKYLLVFTSSEEANQHLRLHQLLHKRRAIVLRNPHEAVSLLGQLATDGYVGIIADFTNRKGGRRIFDIDPVLRQMRQLSMTTFDERIVEFGLETIGLPTDLTLRPLPESPA